MLPTTVQAFRAILTADPSVNPPERNRLLSLMRQGPEAKATPTAAPMRVQGWTMTSPETWMILNSDVKLDNSEGILG